MARASLTDPAPCSRWRGVLPWLLASLLVHALWLAPPVGRPTTDAMPSTPWAFQARVLTPPSRSTAPPAGPSAPSPETSAVQPPTAAPTKPLAAAAARSTAPSVPLPQAVPDAPPPSLAPNGRLSYALLWQGQAGEALIEWHMHEGRYRLRLERRTDQRALPSWYSEGLAGADGLQPLQFRAERLGKVQTGWRFEPAAGLLRTARGATLPAPPGTQDRLSWMWQLAAQAAAHSATQALRAGTQLRLTVASWRGEPQTWVWQVEPDTEQPQWVHLRRLPPEGSLLEQRMWLDPARGFVLARLEQRFDDTERWSLNLRGKAPPP